MGINFPGLPPRIERRARACVVRINLSQFDGTVYSPDCSLSLADPEKGGKRVRTRLIGNDIPILSVLSGRLILDYHGRGNLKEPFRRDLTALQGWRN